MKHLTDFC